MASAKYRLLRRLMEEKGIEGKDIAEEIGRTENYVSTRITGNRPWDQDEMYKVMDMLGQPYENIPYIFPVGGMWAGEIPVKGPTENDRIAEAVRNLLREVAMA